MFTLNSKGRLITIDQPVVMGIINTTPDSFYEHSRVTVVDDILRKAEQMISEGAFILDIGGQSTRPGSQQVNVEEELNRVMGPIEAVSRRFPEAIISIDSYYGKVAKEAVAAGAGIINDISAGSLDPSFGDNGIVRNNFVLSNTSGNTCRQILLHPDGSFYLIFDMNGQTFVTHRLANGTVDAGYGENGFFRARTHDGSQRRDAIRW